MADANILLDTSLRSNTLAIHSLLENVKHSQILQDKSAACEWITASNKLLNSHKDRWMGTCLLGCLVEQCNTEVFSCENCLSWLKTLVQILQQEKQNINMCKHVTELLEKILSFSVQFSEISRQISLTVIPSMLTAALNEKNTNPEISLLVMRTCIQFYPGASGSFVKRIESLILQIFDSDNYFLIQINKQLLDEVFVISRIIKVEIACSCFAILPKCGSSSGTGLDKQTASWEIQWKKILSTFSPVIGEFYSNYETGSTYRVDSEALHFKAIPVVEPQRTETCVLRIKFLLKCLDLMLRNEFSKSVNIPLDSTIKIIQAILAVNEKSIKNNVALESVLLKSSLCAVHLSAIEFLSTLISSCGMSLLPYHHIITRMLLLELSWSECNEKVHGFQQKYSELRSAVYDCVQYLVHITSSVGENSEKIKNIIRHVIEDIKPRVTITKLLAPTVSTSKTPSHGKKAKRKRVQDDVSQLIRTEEKTDYHANQDLCRSGLQALNTVILKGGSDIPSDILKEVQIFVVTLLLECQQTSSTQSNYPIPYGSPDCRKMLYHLLQTLLFNHHPKSPPPLQQAIIIFSQGTQDHDIEVSKFCTEAQMICHVLIHPRVPIISSSINLSQEQEIVDKQNNGKLQNTMHMNDLPGNVEMNVDSDQRLTTKSGQSDGNITNENNESTLEKMRDSVHSTTSSTLDSTANEPSTSNNSSLNKDENTLELSTETQHDDTSEIAGGTRQPNEEITPNVDLVEKENETVHEETEHTMTEYEENIKRTLPEGFEEVTKVTDEGLSEVASDSIHPEKKRKTQEASTSYAEEGVSNNNDRIEESTKIIEQEEDETLAMEMISSFVDSIPD